MLEWRQLSGLSDPYALALAEASAEVGVPASVQVEANPLDHLPDSPLDVHHGSEDEPVIRHDSKKSRLVDIKRAARRLQTKTRNAATKAASTPAAERHRGHLELLKHRKTFAKEDIESIDEEILWAVYLEDIGTSADEFGQLLDLAIESDDEQLAVDLLSVEDQLDEILGEIGQGLLKAGQVVGKGAMAAGKALGRGAMAAGKGLARGAEAVGKGAIGAVKDVAGAASSGFKSGMSSAPQAPAPPAAAAGSAGSSAPQATTSAPAAPASAAAPAAPAVSPAPSIQKKQPGLLGTLGRGIGKVARGVANMATAPARAIGNVAGGAQAGFRGEDVEEWEAYLNDEFGITAEQYIEMCDEAYENNDEEAISEMRQLDEIFGMWKQKKAAEASSKQQKVMAGMKAARAVIAKHGAAATKTAAQHGRQVGPAKPAGSGTSVHAKKAESVEDIAAQIMEESGALAPRERTNNMKMIIDQQLQYSGYTDEYIEGRSKAQQYHGMYASHPDKGIRDIASKPAGKKSAADLAKKVKDPKNELAPKLVSAFRKDNKAGKVKR